LHSDSSILNELSPTPRNKTSVQVSEDLVKMFYEQEVPQWASVLDNTDLPHSYEVTFAGIISTVASLMLPWTVTHYLISKLAHALISSDQADFIIN
jgi:hypothetical protein